MATPTAANNTATVHTDIEKEDGPISSGFSARMRICRYVRLTLIVRMREFCRSRDFSYRGNREFTTSTHTCGKQEVKNSRGNNAQQPFESRRVFLSLALSLVCVCVCTMAAEVVITDGSENMLPSIVDFYSARDVFITGATGFMGKCLLEKLLRSVPDLGSVFVLTRAKKGKGPEQRTKELLSSPVNKIVRCAEE